MKFIPLLSLSLVLGLGLLAPAEAQEAGRGTRIEQGFAALDADKDGKLSATEFAAIKATSKYFREHPDGTAARRREVELARGEQRPAEHGLGVETAQRP